MKKRTYIWVVKRAHHFFRYLRQSRSNSNRSENLDHDEGIIILLSNDICNWCFCFVVINAQLNKERPVEFIVWWLNVTVRNENSTRRIYLPKGVSRERDRDRLWNFKREVERPERTRGERASFSFCLKRDPRHLGRKAKGELVFNSEGREASFPPSHECEI